MVEIQPEHKTSGVEEYTINTISPYDFEKNYELLPEGTSITFTN